MPGTMQATVNHWTSAFREIRLHSIVATLMCVVLGIFHLYTAYAGTFYPYTQRAFAVMVGMMIVFLTIRMSGAGGLSGEAGGTPSLLDWLLVLLCIHPRLSVHLF